MSTEQEYQDLIDRVARFRAELVRQMSSDLVQNPSLIDDITNQIDTYLAMLENQRRQAPQPADFGLSELVGLGPSAADDLAETHIPPPLRPYEETVTSERVIAVGDLYYLYQHEKVGVFSALLKLQQMFKAGTARLSSGDGAYGLYQYDRRQVLRHTRRDRLQAYRRVFGYTNASPMAGAKPNGDFHTLFVQFITQVAQYYRDKRISEVIRPRLSDPSFGSIAVVRRAGLDLRNNIKSASYGHINVLRVEMLQLLDEAFRIMGARDVRKLYGADNAWDVIEVVNKRELNRDQINASQRHRMATAGRNVLHWLAQPHILNASRVEFEALLHNVADDAEEWLTSAETLGISHPRTRTVIQKSANGNRRAKELAAEYAAEFLN